MHRQGLAWPETFPESSRTVSLDRARARQQMARGIVPTPGSAHGQVRRPLGSRAACFPNPAASWLPGAGYMPPPQPKCGAGSLSTLLRAVCGSHRAKGLPLLLS